MTFIHWASLTVTIIFSLLFILALITAGLGASERWIYRFGAITAVAVYVFILT